MALPKSNEVRLICFPDWLIFFSQKRKNLSMYKGHLPTWQALMHVKKLYAHCAPEQWPSHPRRSFGRELLEWREIPPYPATRKSRLKTDPINGQKSGDQVGWQIIGHWPSKPVMLSIKSKLRLDVWGCRIIYHIHLYIYIRIFTCRLVTIEGQRPWG